MRANKAVEHYAAKCGEVHRTRSRRLRRCERVRDEPLSQSLFMPVCVAEVRDSRHSPWPLMVDGR